MEAGTSEEDVEKSKRGRKKIDMKDWKETTGGMILYLLCSEKVVLVTRNNCRQHENIVHLPPGFPCTNCTKVKANFKSLIHSLKSLIHSFIRASRPSKLSRIMEMRSTAENWSCSVLTGLVGR